MYAKRLSQGDTIGIFCPSHILDEAKYERIADVIERLGFKVKFGDNVRKDTDGYIASAQERADDLNALVSDSKVKMILFSGGDGAVEILPLIDYENIAHNPKLFSSYSDATSILNAIHAQTGLVTYYGYGAGQFADLRYYDYMQFCTHFLEGHKSDKFFSDSKWNILNDGICEGTLIGGYTGLFGLMLTNEYFKYDEEKKYLLLLEDHEHFSNVGSVNSYLSFIEQSPFMKNVVGLIFGHYSLNVPEDLLSRLKRFGIKNNIPVVYTDDFGHGTKHAIFPIGVNAKLDTNEQSLIFKD